MDSLECLPSKAIYLLHKNKLLRPLIKEELINNLISKVEIDEKFKEKIINDYRTKIGITDDNSYNEWLKKNKLSKIDFENITLKDIRFKIYSKENFEHQAEGRFLERKSQLDVVVYSLIRSNDLYKAQEMYLRILGNEADFGELATMFSEGPEKKSRGIVGPVSMEQSHPDLAKVLKASKPGEIQPPIKIAQSYIVIRLESYVPATLNDLMRRQMEEELFNIQIDKETNKYSETLLKSIEN